MASIYRRGKVWWGKAQRDGRVHRVSLRTSSKTTAERRLRTWLDEMDGMAWGEKPARSYKELVVSFVANHLPKLAVSSQERYLQSMNNLDEKFAPLMLPAVSPSKMTEFSDARRKAGVTESTIRRDLMCLSSMFTHAIDDLEWLDSNPVAAYLRRQNRRGLLKPSDPKTRYLSHEEEEDLLAACKGNLGDMVAFVIDTGLRLDEAFSLTWPEVNLKRMTVTVTGKGTKTRTVPLWPRAGRILEKTPRHLRRAGTPDWVFCKRNGERYEKRTRGLTAAVARANEGRKPPMAHVTWHDLRRTCGCRLLQDKRHVETGERFSMEDVQLWLGHESVTVTERHYAFLDVEKLRRAVTKTGTEAPAPKEAI
jgi:integrase